MYSLFEPQVENGLKRNYAMRVYEEASTFDQVNPGQDLESNVNASENPPVGREIHCPPPPANSVVGGGGVISKAVAEEESTISALQSFMEDMISYPFAQSSGLRGFPSLVNQTSSNPDLVYLSGITSSQVDMNVSLSSDELNRSSVLSKRNGKGAAPLPIIDDSADDQENVFLTGFHLKDNFSIIEEQDPHDEVVTSDVLKECEGEEFERSCEERQEDIVKQNRKFYRRYPPPLASHLINDSDMLVDNIISKFNDLSPRPVQKLSAAKKCDLYRDPLPRAVTIGDVENIMAKPGSPLPLTMKPAVQDESVVEYRQRTAPTKTFVAPDPTVRKPPVNLLEQYTRRTEKSLKAPLQPPPVTYAVLDEGDSVPNPRLVSRGDSTYKTLVAKRPDASIVQSFKSPRSGKSIKSTKHVNVFLSNEVDENSSLAKMMEVSNQLQESKAKMLEHLKKDRGGARPDTCSKIELKLAL